jgi:predicted nucleotidyltransferase
VVKLPNRNPERKRRDLKFCCVSNSTEQDETMSIDPILKQFKEQMKQLYGSKLEAVILYGSYARGQATQDSDIDLAVVLNGQVMPGKEIDRMIDIITDLNLEHQTLLSVYPVSSTDYKKINSPLLLNLRREGVPV